jgi:Uma2 family endonuclease
MECMASLAFKPPLVSPEEYLTLERAATSKSEYWFGEIFAMAGAAPPHIQIQANVTFETRLRLEPPCRIYGSDTKIGIHRGKTGFAYPDAVIICGRMEFVDPVYGDVITNPYAIFEILSTSTEKLDRVFKFEHYRKLESLRHYVLLRQDRAFGEHYARQPDGSWLLRELTDSQPLFFEPLREPIPIAQFYDQVDFDWTAPAA